MSDEEKAVIEEQLVVLVRNGLESLDYRISAVARVAAVLNGIPRAVAYWRQAWEKTTTGWGTICDSGHWREAVPFVWASAVALYSAACLKFMPDKIAHAERLANFLQR